MTALIDPIPLRQNLVWGQVANGSIVYLPHRYGITGGELIQYDRQRVQFVWADHAVESIDSILLNGVPAADWTWGNQQDVTGHAVAMVTFQQPIDLGVVLIARGKGKPHPRTGVRMTDPAAILWDMLANICGRAVTEASLAQFSTACAARGLEASGSIDSADSAMKVALEICASVGAVYSSAAPPAIWPGSSPGPSLATIDAKLAGVTASAPLSAICNDLTIRYDFEAGSPRQSLQLDCPDSVTRFTRRPLIVDAKWCASARTAYDVASRTLAQRARAQFAVHVADVIRPLQNGQYVTMAHPIVPATGVHMVLATEYNFGTGLTAIDLSIPVGGIPPTRIVQQSEAFDAQSYAAVGVQTIGSDRVLNLVDTDGTPLVNASVTLDGRFTAFTDVAGRVTFSALIMPTGQHTLTILTADGRHLTTTVLVQ